ncbi:hypothetical protein Tco_0913843 [Tanacetum coccineum]
MISPAFNGIRRFCKAGRSCGRALGKRKQPIAVRTGVKGAKHGDGRRKVKNTRQNLKMGYPGRTKGRQLGNMYTEVFEYGHKKFSERNPITAIIKNPSIYAYFTGRKLDNGLITPWSHRMHPGRNIKGLTKAIYHFLGHNRVFSNRFSHLERWMRKSANLKFEETLKRRGRDDDTCNPLTRSTVGDSPRNRLTAVKMSRQSEDKRTALVHVTYTSPTQILKPLKHALVSGPRNPCRQRMPTGNSLSDEMSERITKF